MMIKSDNVKCRFDKMNKLIDADELLSHTKEFVTKNSNGSTCTTSYIDPYFVIEAEDKSQNIHKNLSDFIEVHSAETPFYLNVTHIDYLFEISVGIFKTRIQMSSGYTLDVNESVKEIMNAV